MTRWLDDVLRIPGTRFGVGLDAVLGALLPGAGDAVTGVSAAALLLLAVRERVPSAIIGRMLFNLTVDVVLGTIPIVGDVFDAFWRSNRRNLELIEQYRGGKEQPSTRDYLLLAAGLVLCLGLIAMPVIWFFFLGSSVFSLLDGGQGQAGPPSEGK